MPILNGIGKLNQEGFLRELPAENTQQFVRKYKFHPIHFSESLEYCYNVNFCLRETLEGAVEAEWLIKNRRKTAD